MLYGCDICQLYQQPWSICILSNTPGDGSAINPTITLVNPPASVISSADLLQMSLENQVKELAELPPIEKRRLTVSGYQLETGM